MGYNRNILDAERIIPKVKLEELYLEKKLSDPEIGKLYGISGGRIHRLRNRYNIKAIECYERHYKQELDEKEKSFIVGVLLGDGHMRLRRESGKRSYPQLMIEQSVKHREYAFWLRNEIKDWLYDPNKSLKQRRQFNKKYKKAYHSYPFSTICHPVFNEFYNGFYKDKSKILNINLLEKYFTLYSFAIWLMDDGTRSKRGRRIQMCTHNFSRKENNDLRAFLNNRFDFTAHIRVNKATFLPTYYLDFSVKSTNLISEMLRDLVIPSMQYKLVSSETTNGTRE